MFLNEVWRVYQQDHHKLSMIILKMCESLIIKITLILPFLTDKLVEYQEKNSKESEISVIEPAL